MAPDNLSRRQFLSRGTGLAAAAGAGLVGSELLSACGSSEDDSGSAPQHLSGHVEIDYWHINTSSFGLPAVKKLVADFQRKNPKITVRQHFQPNSYTGLLSNLQTALAANRAPDVAQIGYLYLDYVKSNFPYVSADDLIDSFGPKDFFDSIPHNTLKLGLADKEQIGVPYAVSNIMCYYNADMLKKAGVDPDSPPQTWPEWRDAAAAAKTKLGKQLLYIQVLDDNWSDSALIQSHGASLTKCDGGEVKAAFDSKGGVAAIQYWADLVKDGMCLNVGWTQGGQEFLAGKVGTFMTTIAKRSTLQKSANFDLRGTTWPSFPGYDVSLPAGGNSLVVFSQDAQKKLAAWKFVQYLLSPEGLTTWVKGTGYVPPIEGISDDPKYLGGYFKKNPIAKVGEKQLPLTGPWYYFPGKNGLQAGKKGLFKEGLQPALGGTQTAKESLTKAADTVDELIAGEKC